MQSGERAHARSGSAARQKAGRMRPARRLRAQGGAAAGQGVAAAAAACQGGGFGVDDVRSADSRLVPTSLLAPPRTSPSPPTPCAPSGAAGAALRTGPADGTPPASLFAAQLVALGVLAAPALAPVAPAPAHGAAAAAPTPVPYASAPAQSAAAYAHRHLVQRQTQAARRRPGGGHRRRSPAYEYTSAFGLEGGVISPLAGG